MPLCATGFDRSVTVTNDAVISSGTTLNPSKSAPGKAIGLDRARAQCRWG